MSPVEAALLARFQNLPGIRHVRWAGPDAAKSVPLTPALLLAWHDMVWNQHLGPRWVGRFRIYCRLVQAAPVQPAQALAGVPLPAADPLVSVSQLLQVLAQPQVQLPTPPTPGTSDGPYRLGPCFPTEVTQEAAPAGLQVLRIRIEGLMEQLTPVTG